MVLLSLGNPSQTNPGCTSREVFMFHHSARLRCSCSLDHHASRFDLLPHLRVRALKLHHLLSVLVEGVDVAECLARRCEDGCVGHAGIHLLIGLDAVFCGDALRNPWPRIFWRCVRSTPMCFAVVR